RRGNLAAVAADIGEAHVVDEDDQNIGPFRRGGFRRPGHRRHRGRGRPHTHATQEVTSIHGALPVWFARGSTIDTLGTERKERRSGQGWPPSLSRRGARGYPVHAGRCAKRLRIGCSRGWSTCGGSACRGWRR